MIKSRPVGGSCYAMEKSPEYETTMLSAEHWDDFDTHKTNQTIITTEENESLEICLIYLILHHAQGHKKLRVVCFWLYWKRG